nr:B466 [uncultured bacterium]
MPTTPVVESNQEQISADLAERIPAGFPERTAADFEERISADLRLNIIGRPILHL